MVGKESEKKWLVLLVILVALSLVVDLLSLNVLYGLRDSSSALSGDLFTKPSEESCYSTCYSLCLEWKVYESYPYADPAIPGQCKKSCISIAKSATSEPDCCYAGWDPYYGCCDPEGAANGLC